MGVKCFNIRKKEEGRRKKEEGRREKIKGFSNEKRPNICLISASIAIFKILDAGGGILVAIIVRTYAGKPDFSEKSSLWHSRS